MAMDEKTDRILEKIIHQELASLPELEAPRTLVPLVMEALQLRAKKPWWRGPWTGWPFAVQTLSAVALLAVAGGVFWGGVWVWDAFAGDALARGIAAAGSFFASMASYAETLGRAGALVGKTMGKTWVIGCAAVVTSLYLTCIGVGTVCFQVIQKRR